MSDATEGRSVSDWLKLIIGACGLLIQTGGLIYYQATKSAEVNGKVDLVNQSVTYLTGSVKDLKDDMRGSVGELKSDVKDLSSLGLKVAELNNKFDMAERRLKLLEDREQLAVVAKGAK